MQKHKTEGEKTVEGLRAWQLKLLRRQRERKDYAGYLWVFGVIIILMRVTNELSSNIAIYIQSAVVEEFYVARGLTYDEGLARFTALKMATGAVALLAVLYKPFADKIGRKTVMVINAVGTTVGMACCLISPTVWVLCIGVAVCTFFTQNDVQMMYILETAPRDKGGSLFGVIKSFGILGLVLVPVLRDTVMQNDARLWREVYLVPTLLCAVIALLLLLFARETRMFIDKRIAYLELPDADRKARLDRERARSEAERAGKTGLRESIVYILRTPELRWSILAYTFYGLCSMAAYSFVESLMTTNGMGTADVTKALYVYPFVYAGLSFLGGFAADRLGRKKVVVTAGFAMAGGFVLFLMACGNGWSPYLVGFLNGIYLGSYWVCGDYISVMFLENVPTQLRASVLAGANVLMMAGCLVGIGLEMLLMLKVGLNLASLIIILPCIVTCTLLVLFKVRETRGTDLAQVE